MKIKTISYGRTIVLEKKPGHFSEEKAWFGIEAEIEEGENEVEAEEQLRQRCDGFEKREREHRRRY